MRSSLVVALLGLTACGDPTGLLVEVTSPDLTVPEDIDALQFVAVSSAGRSVDETFPIDDGWPQSLTILPSSPDDVRITITVTGWKNGVAVVRRFVHASFQRGRTHRVELVITRACLRVLCESGVNCVNGRCTDESEDGGVDGGVTVDASTVDASTADASTAVDGGADGGTVDDAGSALDAGRVDGGGSPDAGLEDAGVEPEADAGTDAGAGPIRCIVSSCKGRVVISEFRTGAPGAALNEFVELYNRGSLPVDLEGVDLRYRSRGGIESRRLLISGSTVVPPGGFLLLGGRDFDGTPDIPDRWASGFADAGGTILLDAGGTVPIDLVAWGDASSSNAETAPIAGTCETSCERKARASSTASSMSAGGIDEYAGNGHDSDDNSADFVQRTIAEPQGLSSPVEMP